MLLDKENLFSNDQSLVASAGAILSEKSIDVGAGGTIPAAFQARGTAPRAIGKGREVGVLVQVTEEFDSAGDAVTCVFALITADDEALTSNVRTIASTPAIAQAALTVGYRALLTGYLPADEGSDRYYGMKYTTASADATAGKVMAGLLFNIQTAGAV